MTPEANDFQAECDQIFGLLTAENDDVFARVTGFKDWTIGDIIAHLHVWNIAADLSLTAPEKFLQFAANVMKQFSAGETHQTFQRKFFNGKSDADIFLDWADYFTHMATRFETADPDKRVKWVGPDMSVQSCIIARQMEHWAHAQAIFDILGVDRENRDRLKNVAHIGVTTFSWSFRVRGETPPTPKPFVKLTAPSGEIWTWNEDQPNNRIEGTAESFCQVVTQCRNVKDTNLITTGDTATEWMAHAQCFAGGAETPPEQGLRRKANA